MCSYDQSLVTVAFLREKLSQPQFYQDLTRKNAFFEGWSWLKFNNLGLALGTNLKFYTCLAKALKLKVRNFWDLIPTFVEVTGEKLVGVFLPPAPILNRVKSTMFKQDEMLDQMVRKYKHQFLMLLSTIVLRQNVKWFYLKTKKTLFLKVSF